MIDRSRRYWLGVAAVVGSLLFGVSLVVQETVPRPDSYHYHPALTSPQILRGILSPSLTVAGLVGHLLGLVGIYSRDRRDERGPNGRERSRRSFAAGWWLTAIGVATALISYVGLFTFVTDTGVGSALSGFFFSLLAVVGVGCVGFGTGIWGLSLLRIRGTHRHLVLGGFLLATPAVALLSLPIDLGGLERFVSVPYLLALGVIGLDLCRHPGRATTAESAHERS